MKVVVNEDRNTGMNSKSSHIEDHEQHSYELLIKCEDYTKLQEIFFKGSNSREDIRVEMKNIHKYQAMKKCLQHPRKHR